jgi:hypothetical protein
MSIRDAYYYTGAAAVLTKLGVSNAWVQQKLLNAYRKGVTPDRALRFENKMFDISDRMLDAGAHLPDSAVPKDLWTIPKTEPRPLRPDAALNYYSRHYEAMNQKADKAQNFLNSALPHRYPVPSGAPKTLAETSTFGLLPRDVEPYSHFRGDLYHLRDSLSDVPEDVIEAQHAFGGQHPRNQYVDKLNALDVKREKPFTQNNQLRRQAELDTIARREEYARWQAESAQQADQAAQHSEDAEAFRKRTDEAMTRPATPASPLKKQLLMGGAALGAAGMGYGAYRHLNKDKEQS